MMGLESAALVTAKMQTREYYRPRRKWECEMRRINHSVCYSDGVACTNQAESFFSRLRRAELGTHHSIRKGYLSAYAAEMAWREDHRRESNGAQFIGIAKSAAQHPVSRQWKGYWQRRAIRS